MDVRGLYVNPIFDAGAGEVFSSGNTLSLLTGYLSDSTREAEEVYELMIYNAPAQAQRDSEMVMQLSLSRGEQTVYQGQWQPLAPLVVKKDGIGIQIGGQFKLSLQPGVYALVIAVKDSRSRRPVQETVAFAVEP
jgi:hypothetical protein